MDRRDAPFTDEAMFLLIAHDFRVGNVYFAPGQIVYFPIYEDCLLEYRGSSMRPYVDTRLMFERRDCGLIYPIYLTFSPRVMERFELVQQSTDKEIRYV